MSISQSPNDYVTVTSHDRRSPEIQDATPETPGAMPHAEAEHLVSTSQTYAELNDLDGW